MSTLPGSLAILAVLASSLLRPTGQKTILEDAKANIKAFSPYQSGVIVTAQIIDLITWRLTNIAEIHASLWALAGVHFYVPGARSIPSELSHGLLVTSARRIFLAGISLPLYVLLIRSSYHWAVQWTLGFLLSEAAMVELSTWFLPLPCAGVVLRKDWPRRPIVGKQLFVSGPCPVNHVQELNNTVTLDNSKENGDEDCQATVGDNLCDRVRRVWPPDTRPDKDIPVGRHPLEHIPNIAQVTAPTGSVLVPWTCGHGRCLLYMLSRVIVRALFYSVAVFDFGSAVWLLHDNTQAVLIRISRILLAQRFLNDLLTLVFLCAVVFFVGIPTYLTLVMFIPWIFRTSVSLQPARNMIMSFFNGTPSSVKVAGRYILLCLSMFMAWSIARILMERDPVLTDSILSYSIELFLVPTGALSIFRRFFAPPKSTSKLPVTGKPDENAHDESDTNNEKARKERLISSWAQFRLTILLPNAAIWIFRRWDMTAILEGP
ncbi:uncharacterized protein N7496_009665 [Penicillium cataractarum]|uniref:Uncharacterized protein n=1 Tax=Penicillium cataractarum TaxID=2100454 RepID=A0A9W9RPE7_9EURO|nr:uncharacterized protein N7496_009665 [Penicillium cataractarum]KAJ5363952.1 hypothetical protein N7496_009665 [Penicillium cataractarum]